MAKRVGRKKPAHKKSVRLLSFTKDSKSKRKSTVSNERVQKQSKKLSFADATAKFINDMMAGVRKSIKKKKTPKAFTTITLERDSNIDLYTFFQRKKLNSKIDKILKTKDKSGKPLLKGKQLVVSGVRIKSRIYDIKVPAFKINDRKKSRFHYGKRKGNVYTNSDMIAYYMFQRLDDENIRLYKTETDGMVQRHIKLNRKMRYAKKQNIEITFGYVDKQSKHLLREVADRYSKPKSNYRLSATTKRASGKAFNSKATKGTKSKSTSWKKAKT